nr:hypothetical protein [uncultured Blautia sp.]
MNRTRKLLKKVIAVAAASSLIAAGGSTVMAAGSYQEAETAAYDKFVSGVASSWEEYLASYQTAQKGANAKITLNVEDTGRALLGAMTGGMDFSWLQSISLDTNTSLQQGLEALTAAVLLNDSKLCDLNIYMDFAKMAEYIQIPDISEGYLVAPMESSDVSISDDSMKLYFNLLSDLSSVLPDKDTLSTLLERYGQLVISNMEDGASTDETVSVEGISEDCTVYEGQLSEASTVKMLEDIAKTAKDDKEIKSLFDSWTEAGVATDDQYQEFQTAVDDLLSDSADEEADDSALIYSRIWVNNEDKVVGREIGTVDGAETTPVFTWKAPSADGSSALLLEVQADGSSLTLTGSGTSSEGLLTGDYIFAMDGTETMDIHVADLETKPEKTGYYNGKFTLTFPSVDTESTDSEDTTTNPLAGFAVEVNLTSDITTETSQIDLTLTTSGAALATLSISGGYGEGPETKDGDSLTPAYSVDDENDAVEYMKTINWDTLAANATAAGVPEELVSQLQTLLDSAVQNVINPDTAEADTTEETTEDTDAAA